ncbi:mechanosensitive ion channel [uncultured Winogradskyella sp.]|mgnify:CR=1 FL=1|uniref:mechanosensitive ion channel n=1 Tax=uncultured Winogradskyella sp. TaxID=395353 RepID=UPI00262B8159|nr:mechanosensitive ion channel [uncultured Winogradskyella sp.]|tara:strand:+ start:1572 stop:2738 length:1167 start_codon:yes stop_codon:yes gene_type:complete
MNYLTQLFDKFTASFGESLSGVIAAILILIIGWFIAGFIKRMTTKLIKKTGVDDKLKSSSLKLSSFVGKLLYFLVMIFVFMLALGKLGLTEVLDPIKNLLNGFTNYIPNIIGAGLVAYIGYMLATIVSELVELSGDTIKKFTPKLKLPENLDVVKILKKVVFIFVFIPLLISAFHILDMKAISEPATSMLSSFFEAIPRIIVATLIILIFVFVGRFVAQLLKELLQSLNIDGLVSKMNMSEYVGTKSVAKLISNIAYALIVVFGMLTAFEKLEFTQLTEIIDTVLAYAGKILFGIVIIGIGLIISNLFTKALNSKNNPFVVSIVKISIIAIFLAIGLRSMGIADEIVNLAFGITLGTVALTVVLSFGLGGREAAGKQMGKILEKFNKN